jgi:carbon storage regulator
VAAKRLQTPAGATTVSLMRRPVGTPRKPPAPGEMEIPNVLVVSRKIGERILIGDKIAITVVKVAGGAVRLGIEAPAELAVMREELALEIEEAEKAALDETEIFRK